MSRLLKWQHLTHDQFLFRVGVLRFGLPMALLSPVLNYGIDGVWDRAKVTRMLIISLIVFPLGGLVYGELMWRYLQRKLKKSRSKP